MPAMKDLYGIFGDPIDHSLSPEIQAAALSLVAKQSAYLPFLVSKESLPDAFKAARALALKGFNLTLPHKEEAVKLVDELVGDAESVGAVNVVANRGGRLVGHNTDVLAVRRALEGARVSLKNERVIVLGAGGAARAAAFALGGAGAAEVIVSNRTFSRAADVANAFSQKGLEVFASPLTPAALRELVPGAKLVLNATSVGLNQAERSPLPEDALFREDAVAVDMVYRPLRTKFLRQAREQGIQSIDGLEILVQQALGALQVWLNRPIDAARLAPTMRAAALEALV